MPAILPLGIGAKSSLSVFLRRGIKTAVERYELANARHPVIVRGSIGIGLFAVGDYLAQRVDYSAIQEESARIRGMADQFVWDPARSFRSSSWRAVVWAPIATGFWHLLDKRVKATGVRGSIIKVAADLATMNVIMTYSFIAWSKAWSDFEKSEPVSTKEVVEFTNERFPSTILRSYIYWLPLHCITYGVVPTRHRLVWVSVCSVGFAALLSYSAGQCAGGQPEMPSESTASRRTSDMVLVQAPAAPPPPGPPTAPPPPEDEPLSPHGGTAPHLR